MEKKTVYVLEDRYHSVLYHYMIFMMGGLQHFEHLPKPVYFHAPVQYQFQKEIIALLEPDFQYVEDLSGCILQPFHGAPLLTLDSVERKYYQFLRNQILVRNNLSIQTQPMRRIYISRGISHTLASNNGAARRQIVNETEMFAQLEPLGFELIHLEPYSIREKIQLFQEAQIIVTPNGGALTMALFAHPHTKIIEIHDMRTSNEDQHYNICKGVDIECIRYVNVRSVDRYGNPMMPYLTGQYNLIINDIQEFSTFIESHITN
jgi:capsular polysaccharide biosynthesis protein